MAQAAHDGRSTDRCLHQRHELPRRTRSDGFVALVPLDGADSFDAAPTITVAASAHCTSDRPSASTVAAGCAGGAIAVQNQVRVCALTEVTGSVPATPRTSGPAERMKLPYEDDPKAGEPTKRFWAAAFKDLCTQVLAQLALPVIMRITP